MFNIVTDSILHPDRLVNYRNRSGWFVFLYLLILAIFVSAGSIVYSIKNRGEINLTSEATGCTLVNGSLVCEGSSHDNSVAFNAYDYSVYFFDEDGSVDLLDVDDADSLIVFQGQSMSIYIGTSMIMQTPAFAGMSGDDAFDYFMRTFVNSFSVMIVVAAIITNTALLAVISLIAMIVFSRLIKYISFGKIYKLVVFASTPVALILVFNNLLSLPTILFIILMALAYRSIFLLQRELYIYTMIHNSQQQGGSGQNMGMPDDKMENDDQDLDDDGNDNDDPEE